MKKRVADIIMEILCENNITDCFSIVGGGAMHLNNAFAICDKINKVFNHHEQACAMAAEAYARASGRLAVVCVTSGPGGLNTLTGVEGAWVDSLPMLIMSGQVRYETSIEYTGLPLRIRGVQEFDIVHSVSNMTKYVKLVKDPLSIKYELHKAIDIAMSGRRGPVWLDIPLDVQSAVIEEDDMYQVEKGITTIPSATDTDIIDLLNLLNEGQRPCILTGSGIRASDTVAEFREFIDGLKIPIVGGALQADILYSNCPLYYGMSGNIGPRTGNFILQNADVILVLGNSLSYKQTGFNQKDFAPNAIIVMVDIDDNEPRKPGLNINRFIHSDLKCFFDKFKQEYTAEISANSDWLNYCNMLKGKFSAYESVKEINEMERVPIAYFWQQFSNKEKLDSVIALGNSNCVCTRLQSGIQFPEQRVLANYGCGSMGDDLPEAIGAAIATKKEVYCVTGDGSVMLNLQELQTIVHYNLPIKIIVFSNEGYGAIRQTCKNYFNGKYIGCDKESGVSFPDFEKIANAFDLPFCRCHNNSELDECIDWINKQNGYAFLEIMQKLNDPIEPRVMSRMDENNKFLAPAIHDMYPFLDKKEINELMLN